MTGDTCPLEGKYMPVEHVEHEAGMSRL